MGGKHYGQKALDSERRIAAAARQAQGEWAQGVFADLVGGEIKVQRLGICTVLAVDLEGRKVAVQQGEQLYEASFRACSLLPRAERDRRQETPWEN